MDFLNIGAGELLVIGLIGLLLFGPEDLLRVARVVGGYVQKARQMWADISTSLETDLLLAEQEAEEQALASSQDVAARAEPEPPSDDAPLLSDVPDLP
ncbi:MAG: twin-arginine translocase TatA/TatE family subunit [Anaerolineae bacterium]